MIPPRPGPLAHAGMLGALTCPGLVLLTGLAGPLLHAADLDGGVAGDLQLHGFASQGVAKSSGNNFFNGTRRGSADFNEFGLAAVDHVNNDLTIGMQIFARDFGNEGRDDVTIDWAYGDYHWRDWLGIRAGKIRTPLGLYNEARDIDLARTTILLPQLSIYNESTRDIAESFIGAELYGDVDARAAGSCDYAAFAGGVQLPADNGIKDQVDNIPVFSVTDVTVKDVGGAQLFWNTPLPGLRLGGTYYRVDWAFAGTATLPTRSGPVTLPTSADINTCFSVASAEYTWHRLYLASEFSNARTQAVDNLTAIKPIDVTRTGWYVLAGWHFNRWLSAAGSYTVDHYSGNTPTATELTYQKDAALALRFDLDPHWVLKLEGHAITGDAALLRQDNPQAINAAGAFMPEQHWYMAMAKTTFSF